MMEVQELCMRYGVGEILPRKRPYWSASAYTVARAVGGEDAEGNIHGRISY